MRLNSKFTWGLAWAGLAVVIAIPSADFLTGKMGGSNAAVITSTTSPATSSAAAPQKTASVTTTTTKNGVIITPAGGTPPSATDPVDTFLKTNKTLPNYISGGTDTQVANIDPVSPEVAPVPFPARPPDALKITSAPKVTTTTTDPIVTGSLPPPKTTTAPVVIVEDPVAPEQQAIVVEPNHPVPPAPIVDDAANWRAKGLTRYLDQNDLLTKDNGKSSASITIVKRPPADYDPDGFYLSDGPNNDRAARRARVERLFEDDEYYDDQGGSFSLF